MNIMLGKSRDFRSPPRGRGPARVGDPSGGHRADGHLTQGVRTPGLTRRLRSDPGRRIWRSSAHRFPRFEDRRTALRRVTTTTWRSCSPPDHGEDRGRASEQEIERRISPA
jgi:hypothetical protein